MAKKPPKKKAKVKAYYGIRTRILYRAHITIKRRKRKAPPYTKGPKPVLSLSTIKIPGAVFNTSCIIVRCHGDEPSSSERAGGGDKKPSLRLVD